MEDTLKSPATQDSFRTEAASGDAAGRYEPRKAWGVATWLTVFAAINFLDKVVLGMVAVPVMHDLNLTAAEFGLIAGSFFWFFSISGALVGFLGNRVQSRWILLAMAVTWSIVQFPVALATSATALILNRVLLGAGEGPGNPVSVHALYKWFPHEKRNLPVTLINQGAVIGLLVAGLMVPYVTKHWGWRANFIVLAAASAVWALGWLCWGREGTLRTESPAAAGAAARAMDRVPYRRLLTDPTVVSGWFVGFAGYWGIALMLTWLPSYLETGLGYDGVTAGRMFAVIVVLGMPASLLLSWLSQRMLRRGVTSRVARVLFACGCMAFGGVLFLLLPVLPLTSGGKVTLLAVASMLPPLTFSLLPAVLGEIVPDSQRSAMLALGTAVATSAGAVAPVVMGQILNLNAGNPAHGFELGFTVCGAVLLAGALVGVLWQHPERSLRRLRG